MWLSGEEARKLYTDAQAMMKEILISESLTAVASVAFYRASSAGDDIKLFDGSNNSVGTLFGLRQQVSLNLSLLLVKVHPEYPLPWQPLSLFSTDGAAGAEALLLSLRLHSSSRQWRAT